MPFLKSAVVAPKTVFESKFLPNLETEFNLKAEVGIVDNKIKAIAKKTPEYIVIE